MRLNGIPTNFVTGSNLFSVFAGAVILVLVGGVLGIGYLLLRATAWCGRSASHLLPATPALRLARTRRAVETADRAYRY